MTRSIWSPIPISLSTTRLTLNLGGGGFYKQSMWVLIIPLVIAVIGLG